MKVPCSVGTCPRVGRVPVGRALLCRGHWLQVASDDERRIWTQGTPLERFLISFVIMSNGCWRWTGKITVGGTTYYKLPYGVTPLGKRKWQRAHRFSLEHFRGCMPPELLACHHCDHSLCVNPDHLYAGTEEDNKADREARRLGPFARQWRIDELRAQGR